jgi:hypothetical protein
VLRRGRDKKRNLVSTIKKRFSGRAHVFIQLTGSGSNPLMQIKIYRTAALVKVFYILFVCLSATVSAREVVW